MSSSFRPIGFGFIIYPDSVRSNWREFLEIYRIPWAESPLHCSEFEPLSDEYNQLHIHDFAYPINIVYNKPHIHIFVPSKPSISHSLVDFISVLINGSKALLLTNRLDVVEYLSHFGYSDNLQYSADKIISHGGFDLRRYFHV